MTTIDLVRHAQSRMNLAPGLVGGRSNHTPLTPAGRDAAFQLGVRLGVRGGPPDALVCTSAFRSRQTAELISAGARWALPLQVEDGLLELSQGSAEGQRRDLWWTPEVVDDMLADPLHHRLSADGENHLEVQQRMKDALRRLARHYPDGHVLAVGHGVAMRTLIWSMVGGPHTVFRGMEMGNLAIRRFRVDDAGQIQYDGRPTMGDTGSSTLSPASA